MSRPPTDLRCLGARALPTADLVRLLVGRGPKDDDVAAAVAALALHARAREAALLDLAGGPRLLAAVELGRRAWLSTPPVGTRVSGPADVAAIAGPWVVDGAGGSVGDGGAVLLALDVRGRLARLVPVPSASGEDGDDVVTGVLQEILMAGCRRGVVVVRVPRAAVPLPRDVDQALQLRRRGAVVGVDVVDRVLLGDDGFCSLLRLGLIGAAHDRRYG